MVLGKITQSGQTVYIITATDIQTVIDHKEEMVQNYGTFYFITIGFSIVLVIIFSALLTGPIRRMSAAAGRIADGNYSERLPVFSNDEMGELSTRFNTMAATIEERIAELSNAAKQKEDFVANFAHELKTPLTSVIGYADMIYQKPKLTLNAQTGQIWMADFSSSAQDVNFNDTKALAVLEHYEAYLGLSGGSGLRSDEAYASKNYDNNQIGITVYKRAGESGNYGSLHFSLTLTR